MTDVKKKGKEINTRCRKVKESRPAFPIPFWRPRTIKPQVPEDFFNGMTMRQYYKAAALQGMIAHDGLTRWDKDLAIYCSNIAEDMVKEDEEYGKR